MSELEQLVQQISQNAALLNSFIASNGLPHLGFGENAPIGFEYLASDPNAAQARAKLANDARKLYLMTCGHVESFPMNFMNVRALQNVLYSSTESF
jgi:hypothetical protein